MFWVLWLRLICCCWLGTLKIFCRWPLSGVNKHTKKRPVVLCQFWIPLLLKPCHYTSSVPIVHNVVLDPNQIMWFNVRLWWRLRSLTLVTQINRWLRFHSMWAYWLVFDSEKVSSLHGYCLPQMALVVTLSFNNVILKWPWNLKIVSFFKSTILGNIYSPKQSYFYKLAEFISSYYLVVKWNICAL